MSNCVQSGSVVLYFDGSAEQEMEALTIKVADRVRHSGFYDSSRTDRVFVFKNRNLYTFFARLALLKHIPQGFNLSVFGNSFVNSARNRALGEMTGGSPKYSIYDGELAHVIAHELAHQYLIDRIGRSTWRHLPHWKQEGIPEYIANIGLIRADTAATLARRVWVLNDDGAWRTTRQNAYGWDRIHYEAGLLVEYLMEQCSYTLEDIISDSVTAQDVRVALSIWYNEHRR
jgi:hypothetical protein